jgi:steroid delta-isomerase-like uncharacterized protein
MASKNVETMRTGHESWNRRDFEGVIRTASEGLSYTDNGSNQTMNREKFHEWIQSWAKAFPDGRIENPEYIDAGNVVIARFTCVGTNDGPFGNMKPTGRKMSLPFCEICYFDSEGQVVKGTAYYDRYTMMTQLGLIQPLAAAA